MSASDTSNVVPRTATADDPKAGSVVLRGVTVALDTDVGQAFVTDCARHTEGLLTDSDIKAKWSLTEQDWVGLATNTSLLDAVRTERERRVYNGVAAREGALWHFAKAPATLGNILTDEGVQMRHRIEAARELRQVASNAKDAGSGPREKFVIRIDLGGGHEIVEEFTPRNPPFPVDGEV